MSKDGYEPISLKDLARLLLEVTEPWPNSIYDISDTRHVTHPDQVMDARSRISVILANTVLKGDITLDEAQQLITKLWEVRRDRNPDGTPHQIGHSRLGSILRNMNNPKDEGERLTVGSLKHERDEKNRYFHKLNLTVDPSQLSPVAAQAFTAPTYDPDWDKLLELTPKSLHASTFKNLALYFEFHPKMLGIFAEDTLSGYTMLRAPLPVLCHADASGPLRDPEYGDEISDDEYRRLYAWAVADPKTQDGLGLKTITPAQVRDAVSLVAGKRKYNPLEAMVTQVPHDKTPRIETFFEDYLGAGPTQSTHPDPHAFALQRRYIRKASWIFFMLAVARAVEPGHRQDTMIILTGAQGVGKTSLLRTLATRSQRVGKTPHDLSSKKEAVEDLSGTLFAEMEELSSFKKTDIETLKAFVTRTSDRARAAFAHTSKNTPRSWTLVGTTNESNMLVDDTGNRRFLPVEVRKVIDQDAVKAITPQLWAEAYAIYTAMRAAQPDRNTALPVYINEPELLQHTKVVHEQHQPDRPSDEWVPRIREFLAGRTPSGLGNASVGAYLTTSDIWRSVIAPLDPTNKQTDRVLGTIRRMVEENFEGWHRRLYNPREYKVKQRGFLRVKADASDASDAGTANVVQFPTLPTTTTPEFEAIKL
jgi:hypothetical protein